MEKRESLGSRLGFILLSAGCAIGLGNVWRFPYITGQYGGAIFVLLYFFFLVGFGLPIMAMEFAVGRASRKSIATSFQDLEPKGTKWHLFSYLGMAGNYLLMMFYTSISGWMYAYLFKMAKGDFVGMTPDEVGAAFGGLAGSAPQTVGWMIFAVVLGFAIVAIGLQAGVERITKVMMSFLFVIMIILVVRAVTLPGAIEGIKFYLLPDTARLHAAGGWGSAIFAAMGQAFFTLSIGMGSMQIFGSYIGKERKLLGESLNITILDTTVAVMSGFIIFPSAFAFGIEPGQGPGLVFVTLPNIFNNMPAGRLFGVLFFIFMCFAALSTVIAVFENIIAFAMDLWGWSRRKACAFNLIAVILLALPAALGFNAWSFIQPLGEGSAIIDLEDFIVSQNILPIGAMIYTLFCVTRYGWGWDKFIAEVNTGEGLAFSPKLRVYVTYILPIIIIFALVLGYIQKFAG